MTEAKLNYLEQKKKLFKDVLTQAYEHKKYVGFLRELLNDIKLISPYTEQKPYNTFSSAIEHYMYIGNYTGEDGSTVALFSVCLSNNKSLENARSMQRNFVKTLLEETGCAGALAAFYNGSEPEKWRLSLVRLDYEFSEGKISAKLTPAKRYSYLVGKNEPCHTAQERLFPIFTADNRNPGLNELEEAFSVEAVTKDFFEKYRSKYLDLKEYLDTNPEFTAEAQARGFDSEQFAKKLLGQIVFLYFIQKKGWLGVNAFPYKLTERDYKNAFYRPGQKPKELMPRVYKQNADSNYYRSKEAFMTLTPEEETVLSTLVKGDKWGDGPKDFMRQIFAGCMDKKQNFFDDYLEPLFYTGLNQNRGDNAFFAPLHRRIPFLNGGLFEELDGYDWQNNNFNIPNALFSNLADKGTDADGILDVFDRYNFTISEDEPMEREVAIDPEMLGKIFENLLDVKDRKSKGAFYTPREIVHYMCRESLINYLAANTQIPEDDIRKFVLFGEYFCDEDTRKTLPVDNETGKVLQGEKIYARKHHMEFDKNKELEIPETIFSFKKNINRLQEIDNLLSDIKVVDLAVGSGAFPLGMLNEIVKARDVITNYMVIEMNQRQRLNCRTARSAYQLKRDTIKNCIFACDIDASATDITKLRLWLSLVIDNQIMDKEDELLGYFTKPRELPNLDCNIICGNSLIDEFYGIPLITESAALGNLSGKEQGNAFYDMDLEIKLNELIALQSKLYGEKDHIAKDSLKEKIQEIYDSIVLEQLEESPEAVDAYYHALLQPSKPFVLWQIYFPKVFKEKGGFDVVIGNPPYVGEEGHKDLFRFIAKTEFGKRYYIGKMDLWYFFTSKAIELLNKNGILSFIAPNNWITTAGGKNMRKHIFTTCKLKKYITFNNIMIFDSANQQTMIFVIEKQKELSPYDIYYKTIDDTSLNKNELNLYLNTSKLGYMYFSKFDPTLNSNGESVQFLAPQITKIIEKIQSSNCFYLNKTEITNGIHPHHGSVSKKMLPLLPNSKIGDGIFILSLDELNQLHITNFESNLLKPYYDTNSIRRYYFNSEITKYIIYTTSEFKDSTLMDKYPIIKAHLDKYKEVITSDNKPYGLHRARNQDFFENPAVLSLRKCTYPEFSYIEKPAYVTAEWYLIKTDRISLKFLTCLLNSTLIKFWFLKMGKMQGNTYQIDKEPLLKVPIIIPSKNIEFIFENYCDQIYKIRNNNKNADITNIESSIDKEVYKLYNLSSEEITLIENISR